MIWPPQHKLNEWTLRNMFFDMFYLWKQVGPKSEPNWNQGYSKIRLQPKVGYGVRTKLIDNFRWSIHGSLDVTLMPVFCRRSSTKLRQNYNTSLTKRRQSLVDENPKLSKTHPGGREAAPGCILLSVGSHRRSFVEVVSKICYSFVEALSKTSNKRQALKWHQGYHGLTT